MSKIKFTIGKTLNSLNITKHKLATESKVRYNTITDMASNQTKSINIQTLTAILDALNEIANEKGIKRTIDVSDVFIYVKK